jgi:hypothetical protein
MRAPTLADGVLGTLVITDNVTGNKNNIEVKMVAANAEKTTYSTGDVIASNGRVLEARIGDSIVRAMSGSLWSVPLKAGTNGEASILRTSVSFDSPGKIVWKTMSAGENKVLVEATVSYRAESASGHSANVFGKWIGTYRGDQPLVESFSTAIRSSTFIGATNSNTAAFTPK